MMGSNTEPCLDLSSQASTCIAQLEGVNLGEMQVDHGMLAGDQGVHDRRVYPRTARDSVSDLRGRNLGCLVTRSLETPCQPHSSLRSAKSNSVKRGQQE